MHGYVWRNIVRRRIQVLLLLLCHRSCREGFGFFLPEMKRNVSVYSTMFHSLYCNNIDWPNSSSVNILYKYCKYFKTRNFKSKQLVFMTCSSSALHFVSVEKISPGENVYVCIIISARAEGAREMKRNRWYKSDGLMKLSYLIQRGYLKK